MIGITATPLPHSAVVHYDVSSVEMEAQQPETTPIAHFESTPSENVGTLLDVNANYVVYAVKNGLVRVLDRRSTLRTLLRGHTEKVTDVEFFQNGDVLGTVGGNVIIWRIFSREDSSELTAEKLLEIPSDAHNLPNVSRLIWHPFNPNQFWLIHDDVDNADDTTPLTSGRSAIATLVETTRITTNAHGNGEPHAVCQFFSPGVVMDGALQLACEGVLDLCWSGRDARHVLTPHKDGCIRLWDVKQLNEKVSNHVKNKVGGDVIDTTHLNIAKCVATIVGQQGDGPVTRCFFLPHDDTDSENRSNNLTSPFVTATHRNSCVTLWSPFKEDGSSPPTKLAVFWVKDSNNDLGYNLSPCFGGIPVGNAPPASFLLFSDRSHGNIYALALKSKWSSSEGNAGPKRAILDGWDYIVPFECMHPVYSWSLTCAPAQTLDEDGGDGGDGNSQGPLIDMHLYSVQSRVVQLLTLTHAMCVPPPACTTWQGISDQYLEYGIRIESIESSNLAAAPAADEFEEDDYELEGDELGDAEFEDYDDDDQEEEEDPHNHNGAAPNAPATDTSNDQGNPFPNWLGAIIGNKSAASPDAKEIPSLPPPPPPPPPPPTVISTPAPPAPGLDLESSPLPPGMATIATATSGTTIAASSNIINTSNNSKSSRLGSAFLSPIELLSSSTSGTNLDKAAGALPKLSETVNLIEIQQQQQQQKNKTQKKKSPRSRSPIPKGKKNNKSGKNNNNMPSMPVPSADGKIAILKRDGAAPQLPSAPIPDRQSPPSLDNAALGVPPIVARGDMEDVLKRIIAAQFKKHEQIVSTEIQRAVRSEVQNTVLPTLSKTIAQTMEQSVVKPLQLAFKQSSKESTKVRTAEVIEAVSGSVEEPLKDAFSQVHSFYVSFKAVENCTIRNVSYFCA